MGSGVGFAYVTFALSYKHNLQSHSARAAFADEPICCINILDDHDLAASVGRLLHKLDPVETAVSVLVCGHYAEGTDQPESTRFTAPRVVPVERDLVTPLVNAVRIYVTIELSRRDPKVAFKPFLEVVVSRCVEAPVEHVVDQLALGELPKAVNLLLHGGAERNLVAEGGIDIQSFQFGLGRHVCVGSSLAEWRARRLPQAEMRSVSQTLAEKMLPHH